LGIAADESPQSGGPFGPYRQSERLEIYRDYAQRLIDKNKAYRCFCSEERLAGLRKKQWKGKKMPQYDGRCRSLTKKEAEERASSGEKYVIRLKVPLRGKIAVEDLIRGRISFDARIVDDQVLLKSDGFPTYHLAVVVDDHLMEITHAVRGEEWLSSAPKHVLLYQYFGWKPPVFVHTPTLRNPDKSKMSKRQNHTNLFWYRQQGFLPEALLNFLALLGWSHPEEKEIFSLKEFISLFDFKDLSPVAPVFDQTKLEWMNGIYIRKKTDKQLADLLKPFLPELDGKRRLMAAPLIRERIKKLAEARDLLEFTYREMNCSKKLLLDQGLKAGQAREMLKKTVEVIEKIGTSRTKKLQGKLLALIEKEGWKTGKFFMIFRLAVCGKGITPPIVESLPLLGKKKVIDCLNRAADKLK